MKTINANSTGGEFIQDINDNFSECMTGGSGDGSVTLNVPLQGGDLKTSDGYVDGRWCAEGASDGQGTWTDDHYYEYLHTPMFLSLKGNAVKGVTTPSGSALSIFCYDEKFTLLSTNGVVNAYASIPSAAKYVKFQIKNPNGYAQVLSLAITLAGVPEWVKNSYAAMTSQFFNYEVKPPKLWDDVPSCSTLHSLPTDATADADNIRYHDNGFVMLPPNYSPTGKPCPVVIFFNGDNTATYINHTVNYPTGGNIYAQNFRYLNAMGYAVVTYAGYTSMWKDEQGATDSGWWMTRLTPASIASVRGLYDYIMRNYNFEPAVYLAAKSGGGSMLLHTALTRPFPVRAAAGFSVIVSVFDTIRFSVTGTNKSWHKMFGCANWDSFSLSNQHGKNGTKICTGGTSTQTTNANLLIANKEKYRLLEPFTMNSDIDFDAFVMQVLAFAEPFNNGADFPSSLTDIIYAAHKVCNTPIKYWCATKDAAVPYTWHKIMVEWLKKSGCIAEMRSYTGDDGSHSTFSGGTATGGKVANAVTPLGTMEGVNIGFIEAVDWFKRW